MDEEIEDGTQWTDGARERYRETAAAFAEAVAAHAEKVVSRSGRQVEHVEHFASVMRLRRAAAAFDDAEFDWCGSSVFGIGTDDEDDDELDELDATTSHRTLTIVGRWDYEIADADAFVTAGRDAYARVWPDDTSEDATAAVTDVASAAREIAHADGWGALGDADGLEPLASTTSTFVHDEGDRWFDDDSDPFAIVRGDES